MNEEQVRRIAEKVLQEYIEAKQNRCLHAESGSMQDDGSIVCDLCDKTIHTIKRSETNERRNGTKGR